MEPQPYVSCIKINGVPIIPPLMTEDLRSEMNYYKQLAIAVEERLKTLEIAKEAERERDQCMECVIEEGGKSVGKNLEYKKSLDSNPGDSSGAETETSTIESAPNIETVIDFPTRETHFSSLDTTASEYTEETVNNQSSKSFNYGDNEISRKTEDVFASSTCSDTITASTDLNQYLDVSPSTQRTTATTTPEITTKPQVPKSLDIIPITVEIPEKEKSKGDIIPESNTTPKLVRQGSYILEAPSPMLLAHMQTELHNTEYIPTATNNAGMKRKEWNISQAKTEWENQSKNKELIIPVENSKRNYSSQGRYRRNSTCGVSNQKIFKSLTNSKNSSLSSGFGSQKQSARSVDCIQTMLDRELVCKSPGGKMKMNNYSNRHNSMKDNSAAMKSNNNNNNNLQDLKSDRNISILNLANRLRRSLGDLSTFGGHCAQKNNKSKSTITENESISPSKSVAVSEKLLIIFKEIQRKHEEQMAELIAKQQREQNNMQKEFEKQQILLLGQIKKTFPGITIPQNNIEVSKEVSSSCEENLNLVSVDGNKNVDCVFSPDSEDPPIIAKCPLDYIYPLNEHNEVLSSKMSNGEDANVEILKDEPSEEDEYPLGNNNKRLERSAERYSNVSRRLFPLDSNTTHVPVPVNILYTEKQIKAATVINAYARGYLVRRLMKTERVIALKNTYKEALHCMLKLHVDAPLNLPELNFHQRLQLQCDAASMNIAELFAQSPEERMQVICQDREIRRSRSDRPSSAHSYSFATQRTLARKKLKEMGEYASPPISSRPCSARSRCQTWTSNSREKRSQNIYHGIKRSTSAGTVRKPWR